MKPSAIISMAAVLSTISAISGLECSKVPMLFSVLSLQLVEFITKVEMMMKKNSLDKCDDEIVFIKRGVILYESNQNY
jgi:hypothetical protein